MKYNLHMASNSLICLPSFIKIVSGIKVISRLLPRQFDRS
jgi:hypothetical protein